MLAIKRDGCQAIPLALCVEGGHDSDYVSRGVVELIHGFLYEPDVFVMHVRRFRDGVI